MPFTRNPKRWLEDLELEIASLETHSTEFVICTRDLNASNRSRLKRFGGTIEEYEADNEKAKSVFEGLMCNERCFVMSYESAVALGDAYYRTLFDWLGVDSQFSPPIFDANRPHIRDISRETLLIWRMKKGSANLLIKVFCMVRGIGRACKSALGVGKVWRARPKKS